MQIILLIMAVLFANLPLLTFKKSWQNRLKARPKVKIFLWLIWLGAYFLLLAIASLLEEGATGKIQNQTWEFYAITFLIYLIFSYPALMKQLFFMLKSKDVSQNLNDNHDSTIDFDPKN